MGAPFYYQKNYQKMQDILFLTVEDIVQINTMQAMYLQKGDVALVRSTNVPEYGDHFIKVTGPITDKPNGRRPQTDVYKASEGDSVMLDIMKKGDDLAIILKLKPSAKDKFNMAIDDNRIEFIGHV